MSDDTDKIEKHKRRLFNSLRKLNRVTSEEELKKLEEMFRQKSKRSAFYLVGLEVTMDRLIEVYNDISDETSHPVKYIKAKVGRIENKES